MRNILALLILLCAPAALGVMAWGLILIWKASNLFVFAVCCLVMIIAGLGVASLLDERQQQSNRQQRGQSDLPPHL